MDNNRRDNINMLDSPYYYYHATLSNGTPITLTNFQIKYSDIKHSDGSKGMAIMADVYYIRENDTFIDGAEKKVSFEIDKEIPVTKEICKKIINEYDLNHNYLNNYHNFVGRFRQYYDGRIYREDGSKIVINKMDRLANSYKNNRLSSSNTDNSYVQKIPTINKIDNKEIKEYRKRHPFLLKKGESENGNWSDYDGVNMETGDLMRIRNLHPIMASDNTHLYTAYISNHPNDNDVELINSGFPVIFETEGSITDIIDSKNIRPLLMLLSKDERDLDRKKLKYIGKVDSTGVITKRILNPDTRIDDSNDRHNSDIILDKKIIQCIKEFERMYGEQDDPEL